MRQFIPSLCLLLSTFSLLGCGKSAPEVSEKTKQQYTQYCARCHEVGAANAPKRGEEQAWEKRLRKGKPSLVQSIKKGLVAMPPMGDCKECSDEDFKQLIDYLSHH